MSVNNGDWQTPSFRRKVVMNIDEALKKSQNIIGSPKEKSASEIEEQIHEISVNRDSYMSMVARIILHLQHGGQNQGQPAQTMNQGPMIPMMQNTNMQQSGQMMVPDPNALRTDSHLLPKSSSSSLVSSLCDILSVESPGSFNPASNPNLGSQKSPGKTDQSDEDEQLYIEKIKQLSLYTEPLRNMIEKMQNDEDVANNDSQNLTNLKRLLSILGNPGERIPYGALLKVEDLLRKKLRVPTMKATNGPSVCPSRVPRPRRKKRELGSSLPDAVESEIKQLSGKFTVEYIKGDDGCKDALLVCSISEKTLPAVPDLVVRLPKDYPNSSPHFDTDDYETSDFLKRVKDRLQNKLGSLPKLYTFTTLLLNWESAIRYVDARR